ncbi:MAG: VWA domain-containing protein [Acidobacteriota bacterium]|jgi:VWFA-related protein
MRRFQNPSATALLCGTLVALTAAGAPGAPGAPDTRLDARPGDRPAAQPPADPAPPTFEETVSVSWVLVPVVVLTDDGYARGLGRDDFRLWVDGRRVPIRELDLGSDAPLSVVWLQDLSGSMANSAKLDASRRAFAAFLDAVRPGDEISAASFAGGRVQVEVPFTDSVETLREAMDLWRGYGTTAIHDAVSLLPELSAEGRSGKRVAVLVTDGQDNASRISPAQAVDLVRRARLPVYVIGLSASDPASRGTEDEVYRYADLLRSLAEATGGRYFELSTTGVGEALRGSAGSGRGGVPRDRRERLERIDHTVTGILEDLRSRYILALTTEGEGRKAYHRFEVELIDRRRSGRHTSLIYRRGYWGTDPTAWSGGNER